jgi:uncharacterized protein YndB with AHSA1/START domain
MSETTQVYSVFIRATPDQVWDAITKPEFTEKHFYGVRIAVGDGVRRSELRDVTWEEPVIELDAPRRLVHGWTSSYDDERAAEPSSRVTWEVEPQRWMYVLSNLKTGDAFA